LIERTIRIVRAGLALLAVLAVALGTEAWIRLAVIPWHRRGSASWHRAWNREVRNWGVRTVRAATAFTGLEVRVAGKVPSTGRYLVVANHQSSIDIPFLIDVLRPLNLKFVAHDGLKRGKPAVSTGLRYGGSVFIGKKNLRDDLRALKEFAATLEEMEGTAVIFPEGIRTHDGILEPFQIAGMRTLAEATGLPILPVVHDGLWKARTIRGTHRLVGGTLRFRVLDPIPVDRRTVYAEFESVMRAELEQIREEQG
jgi:1-acyl-sn-glycerol-3-phosphate acyltransferase